MSIQLTHTQKVELMNFINKGYAATKLQIFKFGKDILEAIVEPCSVFQAPTGLGKSTQLPKIIAEMVRKTGKLNSPNKKIVVTQPRKLAARELAKFTNSAHWVRNDRSSNYNDRNIVYMTEGILINLLNSDTPPEIEYLIIDEAHELNSETIIVLAQAMKTLKCPIMICSATIDASYFTNYMRRASMYMRELTHRHIPVVNLLENRFPVSVTYLENSIGKEVYPVCESIMKLIKSDKLNFSDECVIIFLAGLDYIDALYGELETLFRKNETRVIHCLYGGMASEEQDEVLKAKIGDIILATNVAETSITIPEATMCIDSGCRKNAIYNTDSNISTLECTRITQSMAQQRKGRVGRLKPGKCFRMYTEREFQDMQVFPNNELESSDLRPILLRILGFGVRIDKLDMICNLSVQNFKNAYNYLASIEAVEVMSEYGDSLKKFTSDDDLSNAMINITDVGREIAQFPIDIGLARFMLSSHRSGIENISEFACMLVGIISNIHTWFFKIRPQENEKKQKYQEICNQYEHDNIDGDLPMIMNLFHAYWSWVNKNKPKFPERRDWCKKNMCNIQNLEAAKEEAIQYIQLLGKERLDLPTKTPTEEEWRILRQFLAQAFPKNIVVRNMSVRGRVYGEGMIPFPRSIVSFNNAPSIVLYMVSFKVKGKCKRTGADKITHYIDGVIEMDAEEYVKSLPKDELLSTLNRQLYTMLALQNPTTFFESNSFENFVHEANSSEYDNNDTLPNFDFDLRDFRQVIDKII